MKKIYCEINKCFACKGCEIACAVQHSESMDLYQALWEEHPPFPRIFVKSKAGKSSLLYCHHCDKPKCVAACVSGALTRASDTGEVILDTSKCDGCWKCVAACPFGVIIANHDLKKAFKCDLCKGYDMLACVKACPNNALHYCTQEEFQQIVKESSMKVKAGV